MKKEVIPAQDALLALQKFTSARIAIGRAGTSIPLKQSLQFKLAHAHARDAVYSGLNIDVLTGALKSFDLPILQLHSKAQTREQYLQRPDMGRRLNAASKARLAGYTQPVDVAIVIADGLSASAINENVQGLLTELMPLLQAAKLKMADITLVEQGRVAIADEIGYALKARLAIMLIGERPGLSAADSIGAYLTYMPKKGITDEARNCVSNIRLKGLAFKPAAAKIFYLVQEAFRLQLTGIALKDNTGLLSE